MTKLTRGDLVLSVALVLFSVNGLIFVMMSFPKMERIYPGVTFLLLGIVSLGQALKSLRSLKEAGISTGEEVSTSERIDTWGTKATLVTALAIFIYIFILRLIGFAAASFLMIFGLTLYLGYRKILVIFLLGLAIVTSIYILFARLYVPVPTGTLWKALKALIG